MVDMDYIGGLIGAVGTVVGFIVIGFILIICIWSIIFHRDSGDGNSNDDGGGYGSHGGSL